MFAILMACVYEVDSCVRGYHVYQDTWTPLVGEELHCKREENIHDRHAMVVKKGSACAKKSFCSVHTVFAKGRDTKM